jgi:hypothetical protein
MSPVVWREFNFGGGIWRVSVDEGSAAARGAPREVSPSRPSGLRFFNVDTGESRFWACDTSGLQKREALDRVPAEQLIDWLEWATPAG